MNRIYTEADVRYRSACYVFTMLLCLGLTAFLVELVLAFTREPGKIFISVIFIIPLIGSYYDMRKARTLVDMERLLK